MNFLFFIPLLVTTTALDMSAKHKIFSEQLTRTSPQDIETNRAEVRGMLDIGEQQRELALHNQSVAQGIYDHHFGIWQNAFNEEQAALGVQKSAEEAEAAAVVKRDNAIAFKNKRIEEKNAADVRVPPAKAWMDSEVARVDEEKASLERVQSILEGLMPPSPPAEFVEIKNIQRHLLSRTSQFLSDPAFISSLQQADPAALQQVLDIVLNLLQEGEDDRNAAIGAYNDRVAEAAVAAQNLVDAETALAVAEEELVAAGVYTAEMTEIAVGKSAVEVEKRKIRDQKKKKLDVQIAFTNREIARIDHEKSILENALSLVLLLQRVAELLA